MTISRGRRRLLLDFIYGQAFGAATTGAAWQLGCDSCPPAASRLLALSSGQAWS
jgi:hypothetical protein